MSKSNAQKIAQQKYDQKSYDQILIKVKKGKREEYKQAADDFGLGQMELFRIAVEEYIQNHGGEVMKPEKPESISAADKKLIETFGKCPEHVKPALKKLIEQLAKGGGENGNN